MEKRSCNRSSQSAGRKGGIKETLQVKVVVMEEEGARGWGEKKGREGRGKQRENECIKVYCNEYT